MKQWHVHINFYTWTFSANINYVVSTYHRLVLYTMVSSILKTPLSERIGMIYCTHIVLLSYWTQKVTLPACSCIYILYWTLTTHHSCDSCPQKAINKSVLCVISISKSEQIMFGVILYCIILNGVVLCCNNSQLILSIDWLLISWDIQS